MAPRPGHHMNMIVSGVSGCISIAFWIIVFTPQIWECYTRKSSEGLSFAFVVLWLTGDLFNVIGALLQHVLPTMTILAVYYTLADLVLLVQCIIYKDHKPQIDTEHQPLLSGPLSEENVIEREVTIHKEALKNFGYVLCVTLFGVIGYFISAHFESHKKPPTEQPISFWGQINGWLCAILYLASRVPQIKLNYDRKSTDGISLLFFLFAVLGNITYVISILAAGVTKHALILNASWLAGSLGTLFLDFIIFAQFVIYKNN